MQLNLASKILQFSDPLLETHLFFLFGPLSSGGFPIQIYAIRMGYSYIYIKVVTRRYFQIMMYFYSLFFLPMQAVM